MSLNRYFSQLALPRFFELGGNAGTTLAVPPSSVFPRTHFAPQRVCRVFQGTHDFSCFGKNGDTVLCGGPVTKARLPSAASA